MSEITPFRIETSDAEIADLKQRLQNTRWPEAELVDGWSQGIPLAYLKQVCDYWATDYDWASRQARLNEFPQFTTEIDGLAIHFIHVQSSRQEATPLLLSHGWPGSIVEFLKVIRPLTDPEAHGKPGAPAFHVVVPSLPGFGFSGKPDATGWGVPRIASAFNSLMQRLGYDKYFAQGGDWGGAITAAVGAIHPQNCMGIHVNFAPTQLGPTEGEALTAQEEDCLAAMQYYQDWDSGYMQEQMTRPQTMGYGLVDSPAALAGWIIEKFWAWTDAGGHPENVLTRDEMLDNVMLYWLPATGASSARIYWESAGGLLHVLSGEAAGQPGYFIDLPCGITRFPKEIFRPSRRWAERRFRNLVYWSEPEEGGHFAAFEKPEIFVDEVRACFDGMSKG